MPDHTDKYDRGGCDRDILRSIPHAAMRDIMIALRRPEVQIQDQSFEQIFHCGYDTDYE